MTTKKDLIAAIRAVDASVPAKTSMTVAELVQVLARVQRAAAQRARTAALIEAFPAVEVDMLNGAHELGYDFAVQALQGINNTFMHLRNVVNDVLNIKAAAARYKVLRDAVGQPLVAAPFTWTFGGSVTAEDIPTTVTERDVQDALAMLLRLIEALSLEEARTPTKNDLDDEARRQVRRWEEFRAARQKRHEAGICSGLTARHRGGKHDFRGGDRKCYSCDYVRLAEAVGSESDDET